VLIRSVLGRIAILRSLYVDAAYCYRPSSERGLSVCLSQSSALQNKSSAVAEMGDRGHNRPGPKGGGGAVPLSRSGGKPSQCGLRGGLYFSTKWRLHPSSRLTTIL